RIFIDDYFKRYPELAREQLAAELIAWEYRVRRRWGDRPDHQAYLQRFSPYRTKLPQLLKEIDAELAAEFAPQDSILPKDPNSPKHAATAAIQAEPAGRPASPTVSVSTMLDAIRRHQLLDANQLKETEAELQTRFREPRLLARELVQRGWLSPYQVNY